MVPIWATRKKLFFVKFFPLMISVTNFIDQLLLSCLLRSFLNAGQRQNRSLELNKYIVCGHILEYIVDWNNIFEWVYLQAFRHDKMFIKDWLSIGPLHVTCNDYKWVFSLVVEKCHHIRWRAHVTSLEYFLTNPNDPSNLFFVCPGTRKRSITTRYFKMTCRHTYQSTQRFLL